MFIYSVLLLSALMMILARSLYGLSMTIADVSQRLARPSVIADIFQVVYGSSERNPTLVSLEYLPSAAIDVTEPIVFETMIPATVPEPSSTPASTTTTPVNSPPNEVVWAEACSTLSPPMVPRASSNSTMVMVSTLPAILLVVAVVVMVLNWASKRSLRRSASTPVSVLPPFSVTGSSPRTMFLALMFAVTVAITLVLLIIEGLLLESDSTAFDILRIVLFAHVGMTGVYVMISALWDILERRVENEESGNSQGEVAGAEDTLGGDHEEQDIGSLPVSNLQALTNTVSLPSENLARSHSTMYMSTESSDHVSQDLFSSFYSAIARTPLDKLRRDIAEYEKDLDTLLVTDLFMNPHKVPSTSASVPTVVHEREQSVGNMFAARPFPDRPTIPVLRDSSRGDDEERIRAPSMERPTNPMFQDSLSSDGSITGTPVPLPSLLPNVSQQLGNKGQGVEETVMAQRLERPSHPVLRSISEAPAVTTVRRLALPRPSRMKAPSQRKAVISVEPIQMIGPSRIPKPTSSRIPIPGRVQRPGKALPPSVLSSHPNQRTAIPCCSPFITPTARQRNESGTAARRARRIPSSKNP